MDKGRGSDGWIVGKGGGGKAPCTKENKVKRSSNETPVDTSKASVKNRAAAGGRM